jgi:hypothetical protein
MQKEADEAKAKAKHQGEKEERGQWYSNPSTFYMEAIGGRIGV